MVYPASSCITEVGGLCTGVVFAVVVFVALLLLAILLLLYGALLPPLHLLHFPHLCLDTRQILPQTHSQVVVAAALAVTAVAVAVLTFMMGGGGRAGGIVTAAGFAKDTAAPTCG